MTEMPKNFEFKNTQESITPKRVDIVLKALENELGSLNTYCLSVSEVAEIGEINRKAISEMDEPAMAEYLNTFLQNIQNASKNLKDLQAHTIFRAVLTKAVKSE